MTPDFKITVNSFDDDKSALIKRRLFHLQVTKTVTDVADTFEITVSDVGQKLIMPPMDDEITVFMGYKEDAELTPMGTYTVDEVGIKGPPDTLYFSGNTEKNSIGMNNSVNKSWESITLLSLFDLIAKNRKTKQGEEMQVDVKERFQDIWFDHLSQVNEADSAFLYRICKKVGGYYNSDGHTIGCYEIDKGYVPALKKVPEPVTLSLKEISSWKLSMQNQTNYQHVRAWVYNENHRSGEKDYLEVYYPPFTPPAVPEGEEKKDVGQGSVRVYTIKGTQKDEVEAKGFAETKFAELKHKSQQLTLTMPGKASLLAGGRVYFADGRPELRGADGQKYWILNEVVHRLDTEGYVTDCRLWQPVDSQY